MFCFSWNMMERCWSENKTDRPSFDECKKIIGELLQKKFKIAAEMLLHLLNECQPYVNVTKSLNERLSCSVDNLLYLTNMELETANGCSHIYKSEHREEYESLLTSVETAL